jgi:hypothetical protein
MARQMTLLIGILAVIVLDHVFPPDPLVDVVEHFARHTTIPASSPMCSLAWHGCSPDGGGERLFVTCRWLNPCSVDTICTDKTERSPKTDGIKQLSCWEG